MKYRFKKGTIINQLQGVGIDLPLDADLSIIEMDRVGTFCTGYWSMKGWFFKEFESTLEIPQRLIEEIK